MKVTLVSLAPYPIKETRPSMVPFEYVLSASDGKTPSVLVIDNSVSALYLVGRPDTFPVPIPAEDLAEDLVKNHLTSQIEYSEDSHPAFFWLPGNLSPSEVLNKHAEAVKFYINKQVAWFVKLDRTASDEWNKTHQRKLISDKHILAAQKLGVKREWAEVVTASPELTIELMDCPFCFTKVQVRASICFNCKSSLVDGGKKIS